jgi:hypothetical protein
LNIRPKTSPKGRADAVFTIGCGVLDAVTVSAIVAWLDVPPFCSSRRTGTSPSDPARCTRALPALSGDTEALTYVSDAGSVSAKMMPP